MLGVYDIFYHRHQAHKIWDYEDMRLITEYRGVFTLDEKYVVDLFNLNKGDANIKHIPFIISLTCLFLEGPLM